MPVRRINCILVAPLSIKNIIFASKLIYMDKINALLQNCATIDEMLDHGEIKKVGSGRATAYVKS